MSVEYVTYRAANFPRPLWPYANSSEGRWNRPADGLTVQYLSLHPMTPWAELLRNLDLRGAVGSREMRIPLWAVRIALQQKPYALTWDSIASDHGLEADDLVSDDRTICQSLAKRLSDGGVEAFTAPSAALPGTRNLLVLRPLAVVDFHQEFFDDDTPAALLHQDGRCPEGLWEAVHYQGAAADHPELAAWRDSEDYEFEQPAVTAGTLAVA